MFHNLTLIVSLTAPKLFNFFSYYMPLVPLWSGIILSIVNSKGSPTDSNAIAENWFRIVKHNIPYCLE